ncbi:MAG TPA: hypothetical protein VFU15_06835, partial [Bacteroidia bacterium]|nr:hypothetical protein [Bacteroidia bacterium]
LFFSAKQRMEISSLNFQLGEENRLIAQEQKTLGLSQSLMDGDKALLDQGQASVTDFILAVKNNIDLHHQLNISQVRKLEIINELNYWNW